MTREEQVQSPEPSNDTESQTPGDPAQQGAKGRYLLIAVAVLILDQWTKWLVETHLSSHASVEVIKGFLDLTHVRNTGVAFGFFATHGNTSGTLILTILGLAALSFVGYYFWIVPRSDRSLLIALSLVIGGAVGNLVDRIMQGGVTDFIDFYYGTYHWHTFNVADTAISIGIGLMILGTFRSPPADSVTSNESPDDGATATST